MKKGYVAYLVVGTVLCIAGLIGLNRIVATANAKLAAIGAEPAVEAVPVPAPAPAVPAEDAAAAAAARKAADEQTARIRAEMAKLAIDTTNEKPAPPSARYYTPSAQKATGRTYGNDALKPDVGRKRVIVDFTPEEAAGLDYEAAVKSGRCAVFSFVPDPTTGKRINRLYCDPVVAKN